MKIFKNKKILVVGLAKSGAAAVRLLHRFGAQVLVTDQKSKKELASIAKSLPRNIPVSYQSDRFFKEPLDLIVISPGVPWHHPRLIEARKKGIPVWSELELAWRCIRPGKTVAVTGTNGKTTTTAMIGHILKKSGKRVLVAGNIGTPLSSMVGKMNRNTYLVLEISSYQLEGVSSFHPNVGLFLNLTPDHMARHHSMNEYAKAKARLFKNFTSKDFAVLNSEDKWCRQVGKTIRSKKTWFPSRSLQQLAKVIQLPGEHNLHNAMASAAACKALGLSDRQIKKGIAGFRGVAHRIQTVAKKRNVRYVNDSKSTNVDSTFVALKSFTDPLWLILGGEHKGNSYKPLAGQIRRQVKGILTIGEAAAIIHRDLKKAAPVIPCKTMDKAVRYAHSHAVPGDVVLLSPACASFDQFKNYEHRGDTFVRLVKGLPK